MPFKEKSSFSKREYEYQSPDGDNWYFIVSEHDGRKYIQYGQDAKEPITIDGEFLLDMADKYRELTTKARKPTNQTPRRFGKNKLRKPNVIDHRGQSEVIEDSVQETMQQSYDEVAPVESFDWSDQMTSTLRSGVSEEQDEVADTPEDLKEMPTEIEEDILQRKAQPPPQYRQKGSVGGKGEGSFKRNTIRASDII